MAGFSITQKVYDGIIKVKNTLREGNYLTLDQWHTLGYNVALGGKPSMKQESSGSLHIVYVLSWGHLLHIVTSFLLL